MKHILWITLTLLGLHNTALADVSEDAFSRWKLGFNFATQPHFDRAGGVEITTPQLFGEQAAWALHLNYTFRDTASNQEITQFGADRLSVMLEARNSFYKDIASRYVRVGAGYTFISNKAVYNGDGFFSIPIDIGFDVIVADSGWSTQGYTTFFAQISVDAVFLESSKKKIAYETTFDSAALALGFRIYF
ncbi:MAG: hypothetical protein KDK44_06520 [Chlamydiia bacterium]|nr:hypothetical protein [Chlamydiia bacterium]